MLTLGASPTVGATRKGRRIPPALHHCAPLSQSLYQLDYSSTSQSNPGALLTGAEKDDSNPLVQPTQIESTVKTQLLSTVIGSTQDGCDILFEFRSPQLTLRINGRESTTQVTELEKTLATQVLGLIDGNGRIISVTFDPALGHLARSYAQTLLALTQFVSSPTNPTTWETMEDDPNGRYVARYQRESSDPSTYNKVKLRYQLPPSSDELTLVATPGGTLTAVVGSDGQIDSFRGEERQLITVGNRVLAQADNRLELKRVGQERRRSHEWKSVRSRAEALRKKGKAAPLSYRGWDEAAKVARQKQTLAGATAEDLLRELNKLEDSPDPAAEETLVRKISALLFLYPGETDRFSPLLLEFPARSAGMRVVPPALSRAGTGEAQKALSAALRKRANEAETAFQLMAALSTVEVATLGAEQAIREVAFGSPTDDLRYSAQLALGTMARNLEHLESGKRSDAIVSDLITMLRTDLSEKGIQRLLAVLGNSGSRRAFDTIRSFVSHQSTAVRRKSIHALRFIATPETERLALDALAFDPDAGVREEAATLLDQWPVSDAALEVQKQQFASEATPAVRLVLLRSIARGADGNPDLRKILEDAVASDPSEDIRKAASRFLNRFLH